MWLMKKHLQFLSFGIVVCILWTFSSVLAEDKAYFSADKTTPLVGEPIQLVLHIRIPSTAKLIPPDFTKLGSPFFVKEVGSLNAVTQANGETDYQLPLTVILWQMGEYQTSPLVISYQLDMAAPVNLTISSVQFMVPSTLHDNDLSLRPLKPQINLPYISIWTFAIALGILVTLGFVAVRYWMLRTRIQPQLNVSNSKWHPEANTALMSLKQFGQSDNNPPLIYVQVSNCLRHYLDVRLALQASDLTTNELLANLEEQQIITNEQQQKLVDMLRRADLVKFAQVIPKLNTAQQYASVAAQWIQSVEQTQAERLT